MKRMQKDAILLALIESLLEKDSWCGETHIQKSTYFLQELLGVPLDFDFILYKHGPYSFDLSDELYSMKADFLLDLVLNPPYGPRIVPGENKQFLDNNHSETKEKYKAQISFVTEHLANMHVAELEKIATALFVTNNKKDGSINERADYLTKLKKHIPLDSAKEALKEIDNIINASKDFQIKIPAYS